MHTYAIYFMVGVRHGKWKKIVNLSAKVSIVNPTNGWI